MVKINQLINPLILANKWVNFQGDSEFFDSTGELQYGAWSFIGILDEEEIEEVERKYGIFNIDDEILEKDILNNTICIPLWDVKKEFVAVIKLHY